MGVGDGGAAFVGERRYPVGDEVVVGGAVDEPSIDDSGAERLGGDPVGEGRVGAVFEHVGEHGRVLDSLEVDDGVIERVVAVEHLSLRGEEGHAVGFDLESEIVEVADRQCVVL